MSDIGQAYVQIIPSAKGIKGSVTNLLDGEASQAGNSAGQKIGAGIKGAIGKLAIGGAIVAGITKSIKEGGEYEQLQGGIKKIFGEDAFQGVIDNAQKAYKTVGMSANQYLSSATAFSAKLMNELNGNGEKAGRYAEKIMRQIADNANTYGKYSADELSLVYQNLAKGNYTMLDNLNLGYSGSQEGMKALIADAEKWSGKKFTFGNFTDMVDAIQVVNDHLNITGTTAKEAAGTLEGSFNSMKAAASNFMVSLTQGQNISKSLTELTNSAIVFVGGNLVPAIGRLVASIPSVLIGLLKNGIPKVFEMLGGLIEKLADGDGAKGASKFASSFGKKLLPALGSLLKSAVKLFGQLIVDLPKIAINIAKSFVAGLVKFIIDGIKKLVSKIKDAFKFNISLPHIKLPHFSISPSNWKLGDLLKGVKPSLGIKWYAKGGIYDRPTILAGVGDAGPEANIPLRGRAMKPFADAIAESMGGVGNTYSFGDITVDVSQLKDVATVEQFVNVMRKAKAFG